MQALIMFAHKTIIIVMILTILVGTWFVFSEQTNPQEITRVGRGIVPSFVNHQEFATIR